MFSGRAGSRPFRTIRPWRAALVCAAWLALAAVSRVQAGAPSAGGATAADSAARASGRGSELLQTQLERADSLIRSHGGSRADMARLYLTWDAPQGMPRAARVRRPRAHDPGATDTLWLSFLPGRPGPGFLGFTADLYFRAAAGDTLGPWWHLEHGAVNRGELSIECGPDSTFPQRQPWDTGGYATSKLDRTSASARLEILFAIPYTQSRPVSADSLYTLCRVILHHHRDLPGCSQPVCVEWGSCELDYWLRDTPTANRGERFVAYASELPVCEPYASAVDTASVAPAAKPRSPRSPAEPARHRAPAPRRGATRDPR